MKQKQRDDNTSHLEAGARVLGLAVEGRVKTQTQTEQGAHVTQEAGERRAVQVDPLGIHAPLLGFLHRPQQVHAQNSEQQVEANSEGGQGEGGVEVFPHAGAVDPFLP